MQHMHHRTAQHSTCITTQRTWHNTCSSAHAQQSTATAQHNTAQYTHNTRHGTTSTAYAAHAAQHSMHALDWPRTALNGVTSLLAMTLCPSHLYASARVATPMTRIVATFQLHVQQMHAWVREFFGAHCFAMNCKKTQVLFPNDGSKVEHF